MPHIEERPWWPVALKRLEQLADAGVPRTRATELVGEEFGAGMSTIRAAMMRGSVPSFPSTDPKRAAAWKAGEARYEGKLCKWHKTRTRFTNDGCCVTCMEEHRDAHKQKQRDAAVSRGDQ